ncbi:MAG: DUF1768 domain-containing protein, partial [Lachnospiraceae bacterium]|nr:DUF1768 domain-containing protein [Lachnospiraceae bacterium]
MSEYSSYTDPEWEAKYIHMHRPAKQAPPVFFWRDNEANGCFSNWYRSSFVIDDFAYFCVEQYMMAQKARLFHDAADPETADPKTADPETADRGTADRGKADPGTVIRMIRGDITKISDVDAIVNAANNSLL